MKPTAAQQAWLTHLTDTLGRTKPIPADITRAEAEDLIAVLHAKLPHRPGEWRSLPPTDKQLATLRRLAHSTGQTFAYPKNRGHASDQISQLQPRTRRGRSGKRYREQPRA